MQEGEKASCVNCSATLIKHPRGGLSKPLAYSLASLIFLIIANSYPLLSIDILGNVQSASLTGASLAFLADGKPGLAFAIWFTTVLAPGIILLFIIYALTGLQIRKRLPFIQTTLIWIARLKPWVMMDVFLIGIFGALVKLYQMADVYLDTGLYGLIALIFFFTATLASINPYFLWQKYDECHE